MSKAAIHKALFESFALVLASGLQVYILRRLFERKLGASRVWLCIVLIGQNYGILCFLVSVSGTRNHKIAVFCSYCQYGMLCKILYFSLLEHIILWVLCHLHSWKRSFAYSDHSWRREKCTCSSQERFRFFKKHAFILPRETSFYSPSKKRKEKKETCFY